MKKGSIEHEEKLEKFLEELRNEGYRAFNLNNKSPDGIALKNGKIFAVEIVKKIKYERKNPELIKRHGRFTWKYQGGFTLRQKRNDYKMFDEVLFSSYKKNKIER